MESPSDLPMIVRSSCSGGAVRITRSFEERFELSALALQAKPLLDWIHPDDQADLQAMLDAGAGRLSARHKDQGGSWLQLEWRIQTHAGAAVALGTLGKHVEPCDPHVPTGTVAAHKTIYKTLRAMALIVESKNPGLRCSILLIDQEHQTVMIGAGPSFPDEYNAAVEGLKIGPFVGSCGTASFWNVPVVVEDIHKDPLWKDLREAAKIASVQACWSHPITATDGSVLGAMALYDNVPNTPTSNQMDGLEMAARTVGLAIERDRLEDVLRQSTKMEALGAMAGGIAHDFNNLLTTVLCNADLATQMLEEDDEARPLLRDIVTASVNAAELCAQMLAYSGHGLMTYEHLDLNALLSELGSLLRVALSIKIDLAINLSRESQGIQADRNQLRQVIMNLITNAAQSIGDQAGRVSIQSSRRVFNLLELEQLHPSTKLLPGEYVVFEISDTGVGMSVETQARIFDPFYTTKASGSGLGLATVQGIIRSHMGAIALKSDLGKGTTFTILLPYASLQEQGEVQTLISDPQATPAAHRTAGVLVVEDDHQVSRVIGAMLSRAGHTVHHATDCPQAIEQIKLHGEDIDCVLLDYSMPQLDGEHTFEQLRSVRADIPVLMTSGFIEQSILDRMLDSGLSGFIQKPPLQATLLNEIAAAIERAKVKA
jgi:two-component system, cell cycle sensor histidine kinase and response regulator CckA